ncbi:hypothetical protein GSI_08687 [Ganoderma sinense ZZ0214-1]|uniref:BTB domain-containing protein n=1 Tax=Ganoderma sinense ZZ0214-1 TaxID=1077348 RepID=A0A2G8S4H3_9APHY|nr:hypothetical protein GSI_08687 [Ganoderma sinense ZZ0214-1]
MNPNAVFERHPDLYYSDGDVVLAVKQTTKPDKLEDPPMYTLFRVDKLMLKRHSVTFANFFADADAAPTEVYDGVPLAEMHGDKAEDFALLLNYLYHPYSLVFKRHDPNTPLTISGVVRLADKYLIQPLHHCLVQQVCNDWPTTLDEYDIQQAELDKFLQVSRAHPFPKYTPDRGRLADAIPEPVSAILFAQEFGCPQILPAAFYSLSLIPLSDDWGNNSDWPHPARDHPLARWSLLDKENLLRYTHGCQMLNEYRPDVWRFMCEECAIQPGPLDVPGCKPVPCGLYIKRLFEVVWNPGLRVSVTHGDPLRLLTRCLKYDEMPELSKENFPHRLCEECYQTVFFRLLGERVRVWDMLRKWFNLKLE